MSCRSQLSQRLPLNQNVISGVDSIKHEIRSNPERDLKEVDSAIQGLF